MADLARIARAIDFIESRLCEPVTVEEMAESVSYSRYHFCRTFNQATHHPPYDYLMRRRLAEAARALRQSEAKIIDIALDYQFNHPETFSRAFRRLFGMQPNQWRKLDSIDPRWLMPRLTPAHLEHLSQGAFLWPVSVERDAFQIAGVMALVKEDRTVISELWDWLRVELEKNVKASESRNGYGISWYPDDWERRGFLYMAGVEWNGQARAPAAWARKPMPARKYARFIHKGSRQQLPLTLDYVYHTWLPQSRQNISYAFMLERYMQCWPTVDGDGETEIYIPLA